MPNNQIYSFEFIKQLSGKRDIWIWGAGNQGRGICQIFQENAISLKGFIDNSPAFFGQKVMGFPVQSPQILQSPHFAPLNFIIIASFFFEHEISNACKNAGLVHDSHFISYSQLKPYNYSIDVSGACNLRCIACPRATPSPCEQKSGFMSLETFQQVLDKIKHEAPFVGNVQLYQWGEPTLNQNLPEMIQYAEKKGIKCAISSNLNANIDYQKIIESRPEWFRISASGWGRNYEITHTKGKWDVFITHFKEVCELRNKIYPGMKVELYYHLYKHSIGHQLKNFEDLCKSFNVEFHPVYAYIISLDDILAHLEGKTLPEGAKQTADLMLFDLHEGLRIAKKKAAIPCDVFRSIHINWDLSVSNCMMYYYPQGNIASDNYLETSLEEIMNIRGSCELCRRCTSHGMHRYCHTFSTMKLNTQSLQNATAP